MLIYKERKYNFYAYYINFLTQELLSQELIKNVYNLLTFALKTGCKTFFLLIFTICIIHIIDTYYT